MNIIVRPYGSSHHYCRPDTTWERENRDLYSPECVKTWDWVPVIFARVSKAGKCISPKFVSRYYDSLNFGALLYISGADIAAGSCADHTSILPLPLYNPAVMENAGNRFEVFKNHESVYSLQTDAESSLVKMVEDAICKSSELTSLRIGDYVAIELTSATELASDTEGEITFKASFCENEIFNFKIIF